MRRQWVAGTAVGIGLGAPACGVSTSPGENLHDGGRRDRAREESGATGGGAAGDGSGGGGGTRAVDASSGASGGRHSGDNTEGHPGALKDAGADTAPTTGGTDAASDSGASCAAPNRSACDFSTVSAVSCDPSRCCGSSVACFRCACVERCGQSPDQVGSILAPGVALVGQICGSGSVTAVAVEHGICATPVGYDLLAPFDPTANKFTFTVERRVLAPGNAHPVAQKVVEGVEFALATAAPQAQYLPVSFSVNEAQTRVAFAQSVGATAAGTLFVLDLPTGALRSVDAAFPGRTVWVDDNHLLAYAAPLGTTAPNGKGGLYYVDATSPALASTFVTGTYQGGGPLGVVPGGIVLSGGVPYQGGVTAALTAIPVAEIQKVVAGTRATIDVFTDAKVQRITRDAYRLQGIVSGGRWLVSPSDSSYLTWQLEPLMVSGGTLTFGIAAPLIAATGSQPLFGVLDTGGSAVFVAYGNDLLVVPTTNQIWPGQQAVIKWACTSCHGADLAGSTTPLPMTAAFGSNITPDSATGIGDWPVATIAHSILDGVDDQGRALCPSMPKFSTHGMMKDEATDIADYLRCLPPVTRDVPDSTCSP